MNFRFSGYGISDIGLTRDGNEDSGLVSSFCIAVADGMGGHAGGEIASKIAIQKLNSALRISLATDEVKNILYQEGAEPLLTTSEEYASIIDKEETKWSSLIKFR